MNNLNVCPFDGFNAFNYGDDENPRIGCENIKCDASTLRMSVEIWNASHKGYVSLARLRGVVIPKLQSALSFASSVIKSGETWTPTCENIVNGALDEGGIEGRASWSFLKKYNKLTGREKEVLHYLVNGYTNIGISKALHITAKTVENHRMRMRWKFGMNTNNIIAYSAINGLLTPKTIEEMETAPSKPIRG